MRVFLIAGESSGDKLGAALMAGLRQLEPDVEFAGVGGVQMQAQGLVSQFPMNELSVMGIAEVLPKYRHLVKRMHETARAVLACQPDVLITIDSPDFCLRVAKEVRAASQIRTVHYVAPSVWAWRSGRAVKMARHVDQVLALLPFEPPYMEAAGMRCDFVGHPIAAEPVVSRKQAEDFRTKQGLRDAPVLLALPGSRRGEISRLGPVFKEALGLLLAAKPDLRVVVPAAPGLASAVQTEAANWPGAPIILDPDTLPGELAAARKRQAFAAADVALAASGTVSLELCAARTPMVVAYDMNWLSWQIMSRMAKIDTITLANLVTGRKEIPEFLGPQCHAQPIAAALLELFENQPLRARQLAAMEETLTLLGAGGEDPGLRAARAVLDGLGRA